jgi:hypothetical protein
VNESAIAQNRAHSPLSDFPKLLNSSRYGADCGEIRPPGLRCVGSGPEPMSFLNSSIAAGSWGILDPEESRC